MFVPTRTGKAVGEQDVSQVHHDMHPHIHTASTDYQAVPFATPHLQHPLRVPVDAPHSLGEERDFPLHPGPGHVPKNAIHRIARF